MTNMTCTHCNTQIAQPRAEAGYTTCIPCSDVFTLKKQAMVFEDSDGNFQTNVVKNVGRGYAVFNDDEVEQPATQEL